MIQKLVANCLCTWMKFYSIALLMVKKRQISADPSFEASEASNDQVLSAALPSEAPDTAALPGLALDLRRRSVMPPPAPIASNDEVAALVRDRIEFIGMIYDLHPTIGTFDRVKYIEPNGWTHPWKRFDALMNYLALTCFDLLGQTRDHMTFDSWLVAGSSAEERQKVVSSFAEGTAPAKVAEAIHKAYLSIYGMRNSFYHFVLEVINEEERKQLYHSVRIRNIDVQKNIEIDTIEDEMTKLKFLFGTRNSYTHKAVNTGSETGGIYAAVYDWIIDEGAPKKGYQTAHRETKSWGRIDYSVRNWPFVLIDCIEGALNRRYAGAIRKAAPID
jgi:hypothetical protein